MLPPDLEPSEGEIARRISRLGSIAPPATLRERVCGGADEAASVGPHVPGFLPTVLAAAAAMLAAIGLFAFAEVAGAVDGGAPAGLRVDGPAADRPPLAVVDDPLMPIFSSLEPIGSLGPYDEVIADAGR